MKLTIEPPTSREPLERRRTRLSWLQGSLPPAAPRRSLGLLEWTEVSFAVTLAQRTGSDLVRGPLGALETEGAAGLNEGAQ